MDVFDWVYLSRIADLDGLVDEFFKLGQSLEFVDDT